MEGRTDSASRAEQALVNAEVRATKRRLSWRTDVHMVIEQGQHQIATTDEFIVRLRGYLDSVGLTDGVSGLQR